MFSDYPSFARDSVKFHRVELWDSALFLFHDHIQRSKAIAVDCSYHLRPSRLWRIHVPSFHHPPIPFSASANALVGDGDPPVRSARFPALRDRLLPPDRNVVAKLEQVEKGGALARRFRRHLLGRDVTLELFRVDVPSRRQRKIRR